MSRRTSRVYTSADGLVPRAARAAEDPHEMTAPANFTRAARYVAEILKENPGLTAEQAAKGAALKLRADMIMLRRKGAQKAPKAEADSAEAAPA